MKKLSVISILFLCVFVFTTSVYAYPIKIIVEGTILDDTADPLGWGGDPFSLTMIIDSEKAPYSLGDPLSSYWDSYYWPDSISLIVGTTDLSVNIVLGAATYDGFRLRKFETGGPDSLKVYLLSDSNWEIYAHFYFLHCYLEQINDVLKVPEDMRLDEMLEAVASFPYEPGQGASYLTSLNNVESSAVPLPSALLLLGSGLLGLGAVGHRRKRSR